MFFKYTTFLFGFIGTFLILFILVKDYLNDNQINIINKNKFLKKNLNKKVENFDLKNIQLIFNKIEYISTLLNKNKDNLSLSLYSLYCFKLNKLKCELEDLKLTKENNENIFNEFNSVLYNINSDIEYYLELKNIEYKNKKINNIRIINNF